MLPKHVSIIGKYYGKIYMSVKVTEFKCCLRAFILLYPIHYGK